MFGPPIYEVGVQTTQLSNLLFWFFSCDQRLFFTEQWLMQLESSSLLSAANVFNQF
jgi:hypothetical protein